LGSNGKPVFEAVAVQTHFLDTVFASDGVVGTELWGRGGKEGGRERGKEGGKEGEKGDCAGRGELT